MAGNGGMIRLTGLAIGEGIAIGTALVLDRMMDQVPQYIIPAGKIAAEQARFENAVAAAGDEIRDLNANLTENGSAALNELGLVLAAHEMMLGGSHLRNGVRGMIADNRWNTERAVAQTVQELAARFEAMADPYLARRAEDVRDVGRRILRHLQDGASDKAAPAPQGLGPLARNTIIVGHEITPADTALMTGGAVTGLAAEMGGPDSHTAIMARSLDIPAALGVAGLVDQIANGDTIIVDGGSGTVIVRPDQDQITRYRRQRANLLRRRRRLQRLQNVPAISSDGHRITLKTNIELPVEVAPARQNGAEGIGLVRTEFLFLNRDDLPDEEEQYQQLRAIVEGMEGREVTIRTLDAGGDKLPPYLAARFGGGDNPALGLRAIRLSLREPALLRTQLRAILRAACHGPVRILLPMIGSVHQVVSTRELLGEIVDEFRAEGRDLPPEPLPLGVMIEVPGAALVADMLAQVADFFSIGTNDLTMYTLAIDRTNDQVADLYDSMHPAVLNLIRLTVEAADRRGIPVNLCGELAGDERFSSLLVGLGLRELSMSSVAIPRVKERICRLDVGQCQRLTEAARQFNDTLELRQFLLHPPAEFDAV